MKLIFRGPVYYSHGDEEAFFHWLESIPGVLGVRGIGRELHIELRSKRISATALRELIGFYRRYGGRLRDLAVFENAANRAWFRDPVRYWYRGVFGGSRRTR